MKRGVLTQRRPSLGGITSDACWGVRWCVDWPYGRYYSQAFKTYQGLLQAGWGRPGFGAAQAACLL